LTALDGRKDGEMVGKMGGVINVESLLFGLTFARGVRYEIM
jgi:hypothetical protein